jgi:hypothetical protein
VVLDEETRSPTAASFTDDLAIAIRQEWLLTKIIAILMALEPENRAVAETKKDDDKEGRLGSLVKRSETTKRDKYSRCSDIIEPVKEPIASEPVNGRTTSKGRLNRFWSCRKASRFSRQLIKSTIPLCDRRSGKISP